MEQTVETILDVNHIFNIHIYIYMYAQPFLWGVHHLLFFYGEVHFETFEALNQTWRLREHGECRSTSHDTPSKRIPRLSQTHLQRKLWNLKVWILVDPVVVFRSVSSICHKTSRSVFLFPRVFQFLTRHNKVCSTETW